MNPGTNGKPVDNPLAHGTWLIVVQAGGLYLGHVINEGVSESELMASHDRDGTLDASLQPVYALETMYVPMQQRSTIAGAPIGMATRLEQKLGLPDALPPMHYHGSGVMFVGEMSDKLRAHLGGLVLAAEQNLRQQWSSIVSPLAAHV